MCIYIYIYRQIHRYTRARDEALTVESLQYAFKNTVGRGTICGSKPTVELTPVHIFL